ncbi:MAG: (2Fe-2S)-binding protein [Devosia sp.]|nr:MULTISPECIES: (2Fe-2S)-binding protein [unclassified Devosia]MBN9306984.1 (2Fe-2S)-binding protein [Devosia sp.]
MAALPQSETVTIRVDRRNVSVRAGLSLALALMEAGVVPIRRSAVSGAPRSPLCLMGVCFECLVEVDGRQNVQSCMIEVVDGMNVHLPEGARRAEAQHDA